MCIIKSLYPFPVPRGEAARLMLALFGEEEIFQAVCSKSTGSFFHME